MFLWLVWFNIGAEPGQMESAEPSVVERWQDGRVLQRTSAHTNPDGSVVLRTNRWTELATGLHYRDGDQWKESKAEISIVADGAEAVQGAYKVHFAGNLNTVGALRITSQDNKTLRAHVLGLGYTDLTTGQSVLIATARDSTGQLFPPNQVIYSDAFSGLLADVRYSYNLGRFEQDILLYEQPAAPAAYGLNNETTVLEVWTEFDEAPEPVKTVQDLNGLSDETISFGQMRLMRGSAFALDAPTGRMEGASVGKTWLKDQATGRTFLIESVRRTAVLGELEKLLPRQAALPGRDASRLALLNQIEVPKAGLARPVKAARLALNNQAPDTRQSLVLDFLLVNASETDFTFQADTSYLVTAGVDFYGTTTFEGGAVIKISCTNEYGALISAYGPIVFQTDQYHPVIFTSQNDRTVGEDFYVAGFPTNYLGALAHNQADSEYKHLRISYADYGLHTYALRLHDAQFTHCGKALYTESGAGQIDNVLFYDNTTVFGGTAYDISARHVTINQCAILSTDWADPASSHIALTNSLLVNVVTNGEISVTTNSTVTTTNAIFQTVGAGAHYLAGGSTYRHAGTTNIPAWLLADLAQRTTYPPTTNFIGVTITTNLSLTVTTPRGTGQPDLGYHYPPLDYVFGATALTNATLTVLPGVVLGTFTPGTYGEGLMLLKSAVVITRGEPTNLVRVVRYNLVQEQANTNWTSLAHGSSIHTYVGTLTPSPTGRFSFTDWSQPANDSWHFISHGNNAGPFLFDNCTFSGGRLYNYAATLSLTNCLILRVDTYMANDTFSEAGRFYQNSFIGGGATFWSGGVEWEYFNNLFYETVVFSESPLQHGYNAYQPGTVGLDSYGADSYSPNDLVTNIVFQTGPLGRFYLTNTSPLLNRGTNTGASAGLWHFTATTNQVKETNSTVDIGFHYVTLTAAGAPVDTDGDGLADYAEDASGNGVFDAGDLADFNNGDTDNDGLSDGQEYQGGTNPQSPDSPQAIYEGVISNQSPSGWFKLNDGLLTNAISGRASLTNFGGGFENDMFATAHGAYSFANTSDRLVLGETDDPIGGGTNDAVTQGSFTLLFKTLAIRTTGKRYLLSQGTASANALAVYFDGTNSTDAALTGALRLGVGTNDQAILLDTNIVREAWYYLAVTCDEMRAGASNEVRWYLGQVGSPTLQSNSFSLGQVKKFGTNGPITVGNRDVATPTSAYRQSATIKGVIDQVAFWERELTGSEANVQFDTLNVLFQGPAKVFDLTRWNLLLPVNKTNQLNTNHLAMEISTGWLNSGFKYVDPTDWTQKYFYLSNGNTMVFEAPWNGARSSTNGSPRSELRETTLDGLEYNWKPYDAVTGAATNTHILQASCIVDAATNSKVIFGQIHAETPNTPPAPSGGVPAITLFYDSRVSPAAIKLAVYWNPSGTNGPNGNKEDPYTLVSGVSVNDRIDYELKLDATSTGAVTNYATVSINGGTNIVRAVSMTSGGFSGWAATNVTLYFKAGCYYPVAPAASTAKVTFTSLTVTHQP